MTWLRARANATARRDMVDAGDKVVPPDPTQASYFARGWTKRFQEGKEETAEHYHALATQGPWENRKGKPFLTAQEEATLVAFYAPKLATLIGPKAAVSRLKRNSKVTATAALLYRRFFLSNSVLWYDPKAIMVAAAFLASKVSSSFLFVCLKPLPLHTVQYNNNALNSFIFLFAFPFHFSNPGRRRHGRFTLSRRRHGNYARARTGRRNIGG